MCAPRLREHGLIRRDRDVGGELVPEARPHRPAVDRRDDGLAQPPHMRPIDDPLAVPAMTIFDEFRDRLSGRVGIPPPDLFGP